MAFSTGLFLLEKLLITATATRVSRMKTNTHLEVLEKEATKATQLLFSGNTFRR